MSEPTKFTATVREPNRWLMGLACVPLAAIPVLLTLGVLVSPAFAAPSFHLLFLGLLALAYVYKRKPLAHREPVQVEVERDAVAIGDERIERASIERGDMLGGGEVRLRRSREREVELSLGSEERARELLRALELDVSQTVGKFRTMSRVHVSMWRQLVSMFAVMVPAALLMVLAAASGIPGLAAVMPFTMLFWFVLMFWPSGVEVGGDGVLIKWLGRERFVPHAEISHVYSTIDGFGRGKRAMVRVGLESGEEIKIPVGSPAWGGESKADALATRIHTAREAFERGAVAPEVLHRDAQMSLSTWIKRLRTRDVVGHREAVVPLERFWRVIEDAAADPLERAAATVALGSNLQRSDRERLARVAKRTAAPKLRVVLESAPDAAEGELVELLEEVSATKARATH